MPSPLLGRTADSSSTCPPAYTGIFLQRHFLDSQCQTCTVAWGYSVPGAFVFVELHEISVRSLLQPVLILLSSSPALQCIDCSPHFDVICWECLSVIQIVGENCKQYELQYQTPRNATSDQPLLFKPCSSTNSHPFYKLPIQPISAQFGYKDVMVDHVKSLTRVKMNNTHCCPLPHTASHFIVEGNQVGQAEFAFSKSILTIPNHLLVLHVCGNEFQENLLHNIPADWPVVPRTLLLALLKMAIFTIFQLFGTFSCHQEHLQMTEIDPQWHQPTPSGRLDAPGPTDYCMSTLLKWSLLIFPYQGWYFTPPNSPTKQS